MILTLKRARREVRTSLLEKRVVDLVLKQPVLVSDFGSLSDSMG